MESTPLDIKFKDLSREWMRIILNGLGYSEVGLLLKFHTFYSREAHGETCTLLTSGRSGTHTGTYLIKIRVVQNELPPQSCDILKVYSKMNWSHSKIEHIIHNMVSEYD